MTNTILRAINHLAKKGLSDGKALNLIRKATKEAGILNTNIKNIPVETNFYRLAGYGNPDTHQRKDLFHTPFELRHHASTQRYSSEGFPCLYMSNSVYVCWEEMRQAPNKMSATRLQNRLPLPVLNFDSRPFAVRSFQNPPDEIEDLLKYATLYPLVVGCCLPIRQPSKFNSEYLLPRLLLEIVQETDHVFGIQYYSTRVSGKSSGLFLNYAIPPRKIETSGYCIDLKMWFAMTEVEVFDFTDPEKLAYASSGQANSNIDTIALNGNSYKFEATKFAYLEYLLNQKKATKINF